MADWMSWRRAAVLVAIPLLLVPAAAGAYSFLPAGFAPGEQILGIELVTAGVAGPGLEVDTGLNPNDPADDTLHFESWVSRITTTDAIHSITLGDVIVTGAVLDSVSFPAPLGIGGFVSGNFSESSVVDLTILDIGIGATDPVLLEVEYSTGLEFSAHEVTGVIIGSLYGDFDVVGGEADFLTAFGGPAGYVDGVLAGFDPGTGICNLTDSPTCEDFPWASDLADFTASPTSTITPIPDPGTLALLSLGLAGLAAFRRR